MILFLFQAALGLSVRKDGAYDTWCGNLLHAHVESVKVCSHRYHVYESDNILLDIASPRSHYFLLGCSTIVGQSCVLGWS